MKTVRFSNEAGNKVLIKIKKKNGEESNEKTGTVTKFKGVSIDFVKNSVTQELILTHYEGGALLQTLEAFFAKNT
jgi:hypothetical protein